MASYSSYWLYQKYEKRGDQDWIPSYPNTYSIDGEGTMPLVVRIEKDEACGYICDEMERWVEVPISQDYVCDDCEVGYLYRWVPCNPSAFTYYGDYKYAILCEEKSEDGGLTWSATTNTKISSEPIGVAEKKVKITFDDGDVFAESCGTDDGVYSPIASNSIYFFQGSVNHTTNVRNTNREQFYVSTYTTPVGGTSVGNQFIPDYYVYTKISNAHKIEFGDCVTDITLHANNGMVTSWDNGTNRVLGSGWGIEEVVFPDTLKTIGAGAFADNNIQTLNIPSSVERIGNDWECLHYGSTTDCTISGTFAFNCRLRNVRFGDWNGSKYVSNLKTIGKYDFMYCTGLEEIHIPDSVEGMGSNVFSGCSNLKYIVFEGTTPPSTLSGSSTPYLTLSASSDTYVYVPCGSKTAYTNAISDLSSDRIIEYSGDCGSLYSVKKSYTWIADYKVGNTTYSVKRGSGSSYVLTADTAFFAENACTYGYVDEISLVNDHIVLADDTYIGGCKRLRLMVRAGNYGSPSNIDTSAEEIIFNCNQNVNFWGPSFCNSPNVRSVVFDNGVTLKGAFDGCPYLSSVTINSQTYLQYRTFADCPNLTDVYINYSGGVVSVTTDPNHSYRYPFVGSYPTVHVPCELYDLYKSHTIWGKLNIVKNSDDCTQAYVRIVSNTFSQASASDPIISDRFMFSKQTVYYGGNGAEMTLVCKDVSGISFETVRCGAASNTSVLTITLDGVEVFNRDSYSCSVQQQQGAGYVGSYTMTGLNDGVEHTIVIHSTVGSGRDNYFGFDPI